jgi:hypothetical protein
VAAVEIPAPELAAWCTAHLGSAPAQTLFTTGHLSLVTGLRLRDGRAVVVKVRQSRPSHAACAAIQRALWEAGFACPRPLAGPHPLGERTASAEELVPGGEVLDPAAQAAATRYAGLLADLVRLAPAGVAGFTPPPWVDWAHPGTALWPAPDDVEGDLNADPEPQWVDELGAAVRDRLCAADLPLVVGHADWEAQNLRWRDGQPWVVHDWDSAALLPEAAVAGHAAAVWTAGTAAGEPDVRRSQEFLDAYQQAAGRAFTAEECEVAWAAGLWTRAFNVKKWYRAGYRGLSPDEARERVRRAGC